MLGGIGERADSQFDTGSMLRREDTHMHDFRKLNVYSRALAFTRQVRMMTKGFPREEIFVLTSQYRRAADSIVLNIAEGAGNESLKEFRKFLSYSIRSGYECLGCADIALGESYLTKDSHEKLCVETNEIISMLVGLQRKLN